jgi:hypothetical protein
MCHRHAALAASLLGLAACAADPADPSPSPTGPVATSTTPAPGATTVDPVAPTVPSGVEAPPAEPAAPGVPSLHDEPPWPTAGTGPKLILTWVLYPYRPGSADGRVPERRHVELVARIGTVARRIGLGDVRGSMFDKPHMCSDHPAQKGLVAKVEFQQGGWMGYEVHRSPADTITITETYHVCGVCSDAKRNTIACPEPPPPVVGVFHVPADALIEERMIAVGGPGDERRVECDDWG